jgi:hypothetical protein
LVAELQTVALKAKSRHSAHYIHTQDRNTRGKGGVRRSSGDLLVKSIPARKHARQAAMSRVGETAPPAPAPPLERILGVELQNLSAELRSKRQQQQQQVGEKLSQKRSGLGQRVCRCRNREKRTSFVF